MFPTPTTESAQLAMDTILRKPVKGIPTWLLNIMEHDHIDRLAGVPQGTYRANPEPTYLAMQRNIGVCMLDQYIWDNPLSMGQSGYEGAVHGATTGAEQIILDGMLIDSPEAVVEHMERYVFPALKGWINNFNEDAQCRLIINSEASIQQSIGPTMLKTGYGYISFPVFAYGPYGYVNYFSAYALYPEVIEQHFSLQADLALLNNRAAARAITEGGLPLLYRLDFDMADSRGTLVNIKSLDKIWFPHFARCLEPVLNTDMNLIWHCDGNLMQMVPRLLDVGIRGFQGFQYEDGMDYEKICQMKTRDGEELIIIAGVSVTRTLPMGTPTDVKREMEFLVQHGPKTGLFLGGSSSVAPGVPWENIEIFVQGLRYYQAKGRVGD
ncbi:MAG: uroporphyrinogen decarboxylase/cobalamine-independent methonine synthase family protein [Armatimonadota bacterium]